MQKIIGFLSIKDLWRERAWKKSFATVIIKLPTFCFVMKLGMEVKLCRCVILMGKKNSCVISSGSGKISMHLVRDLVVVFEHGVENYTHSTSSSKKLALNYNCLTFLEVETSSEYGK